MITRRGFIALALASACSKKRAGPTSPRVVSLSPSTTEAVAAVGALGLLVGRSRYCDYPREVLALPEVGGYIDPNYEAILALSPTLVVGARGPLGSTVTDTLAAHGVETYFPETESLAQIDLMITGIGARTGHESDAARVLSELHRREDALTAAVANAPKVRALLVFGVEPIVVAGSKTFASEMLERAGAVNVAAAPGYPTLDLEALLALDPDVILNAAVAESHGAQTISVASPGWKDLRAVKAGRVVALADESVLRPGPRVADGLEAIHSALTR